MDENRNANKNLFFFPADGSSTWSEWWRYDGFSGRIYSCHFFPPFSFSLSNIFIIPILLSFPSFIYYSCFLFCFVFLSRSFLLGFLFILNLFDSIFYSPSCLIDNLNFSLIFYYFILLIIFYPCCYAFILFFI